MRHVSAATNGGGGGGVTRPRALFRPGRIFRGETPSHRVSTHSTLLLCKTNSSAPHQLKRHTRRAVITLLLLLLVSLPLVNELHKNQIGPRIILYERHVARAFFSLPFIYYSFYTQIDVKSHYIRFHIILVFFFLYSNCY